MFLITKILDLAYVQNYLRCLSQNKSDTKLFRVYLFTVFTIKRPRSRFARSLRSLNREDSDTYTQTVTQTAQYSIYTPIFPYTGILAVFMK